MIKDNTSFIVSVEHGGREVNKLNMVTRSKIHKQTLVFSTNILHIYPLCFLCKDDTINNERPKTKKIRDQRCKNERMPDKLNRIY